MKVNVKKWIARAVTGVMLMTSVLAVLPGTAMNSRAEESEPEPKPVIWLVGDSTVCNYQKEDGSYQDKLYYYPRYGYGTQIYNYLDGSFEINNLAISGTSSKDFMSHSSGNYSTLRSGFKAGDVLIIGFGHNDEKTEKARYTNPNGDYTTEGSFAKSLYDNYVKLAEDKGGEAILCTPVVRRNKSGEFKPSELHVTSDTTVDSGSDAGFYAGGDYAEAIRQLGQDTGTTVVDLTELSKNLYLNLGLDETLYFLAWTQSLQPMDQTHLNVYGAKSIAWLFANAIKGTASSLAAHVVNETEQPTREKDLFVSPYWHESTYTSDLPDSVLWEKYEATTTTGEKVTFSPSVFGDMGGDPAESKGKGLLELGADESGRMHIRVGQPGSSKGKIASGSDGIAMYFYRIPAKAEFTLSAKATLNDFEANNQVAFGIMARDDMYIDMNDPISSDYVAAGLLGTAAKNYNCFYRKGGALGPQVALTTETVTKGKTYDLNITANSDGYACTFGTEPTQTAGYDFSLNDVDPDYAYIGMFVSRRADVTFSDIYVRVQKAVNFKKYGKGTISGNTAAWPGDTVKLGAVPDPGYSFGGFVVRDQDGKEIRLSDNNSFIMPDGNVTVEAFFPQNLSKDQTVTVTPEFTTAGATEDVIWSVDDDHKKYVKVTNGVVKGLKATPEGEWATVTASVASGDSWSTYFCVIDPGNTEELKPIPATKEAKVSSSKQLKLQFGKKAKATAASKDVTVKVTGSDLKDASAISVNILDAEGRPLTGVVDVSLKDASKNKYTVTAAGPGVAYIRWDASKEKDGEVLANFVTKVIVTQPVAEVAVTLSGNEMTESSNVLNLEIGQSLRFAAEGDSPTDAGKITWSAKGGGVKVTKSGFLTATKATKPGKLVTLTAKCGSIKSTEVRIFVNDSANYVVMGKQQITVKKNPKKNVTVKASAKTKNKGDKITWSLNCDDNKVKISPSGIITVMKDAKPGVYVVKASVPGAAEAECELIVK